MDTGSGVFNKRAVKLLRVRVCSRSRDTGPVRVPNRDVRGFGEAANVEILH
jgi:hypothetical protein